jgi:hypothetical protein
MSKAQTIDFHRSETLKVIQCGTCGIPFALPERLWNSCYEDGGFFTCPLGHSRGWNEGNKKSVVERLKAEVAREKENAEYWLSRKTQADAETERYKNRLTAQKGVTTKLKKRITNGVCPCCNRSFQDLRRHISTKHPDFSKESA